MGFNQFRLLLLEWLTKCKVGQTLLSRHLSQLFCRRLLLLLLRFSSVAAKLLPTVLSSAPNVPVLQQSFVVASGFSPVPPKLVSQIVSGKFIELSELLSSKSFKHTPARILNCFFYGRLVLTSTPKKPKRQIEDIGSWLEAFSVYCLVLTSSISMEGSPALPVADSMDLSPVHRPGVAGLRSGLPRACSCN